MSSKKIQLVIVTIGLFVLNACSSIPITSLLKVASLNNDTLAVLKPNEIRVRLAVSEPIELQTKDVKLVLSFEHKNQTKSNYQYLLEYLKQNKKRPISSFFGNQPAKSVYTFKLSKQSELEFNRFQKSLNEIGKPIRYHWTVYYHLKSKLEKGEIAEIDMELKLAEKEEYFYLLKNAMIETN